MIDDVNQKAIHECALHFINVDGDVSMERELPMKTETNGGTLPRIMAWTKVLWAGMPSQTMALSGYSVFRCLAILFLHAPVVLQSYLLASGPIQAIDICKYASYTFSCEKVSRLITTDAGGSSLEELENMLEIKDILTADFQHGIQTSSNCSCGCPNRLFHKAKTLGPALVRLFKVDAEFRQRVLLQLLKTLTLKSRSPISREASTRKS
jgi:hypothetical protein